MKKPTPDDHLVVYSDGNDDYTYVLPQFFDVRYVDYGQLVKIRVGGKVVDKIKSVVYGEPFVNCIHTNNVENYNGILRERVSYLVRRTKCIAKKVGFLAGALDLFQFYWNFIKKLHDKASPAMLEGLEKRLWSWSRFLHCKIKRR